LNPVFAIRSSSFQLTGYGNLKQWIFCCPLYGEKNASFPHALGGNPENIKKMDPTFEGMTADISFFSSSLSGSQSKGLWHYDR